VLSRPEPGKGGEGQWWGMGGVQVTGREGYPGEQKQRDRYPVPAGILFPITRQQDMT
jgi:hypothetical protein